MNLAKLSQFHKEQIALLQQSVWDIEQARSKISLAIGNSDIGQCYVRDLDQLILNVLEDINNIWDQYPVEN